MTKWVIGIVGGVLTTVMGAAVLAGPSLVMSWMDSHNDERYLLVMDYKAQMFQQELSNYRREADTLEWRKSQAQSEAERRLLDQQLRGLDEDKRDYIRQYSLQPIK